MTIVSLRTVPRRKPRNARELAEQLDTQFPSVVPAPTVIVTTAPYAPAGGLMVGTSQTSAQIATGNVTFAMDQFGIGFYPGQRIRMVAHTDITKWMEGAVVSYVEPNLTVNVDLIPTGAGTALFTPWDIGVTGMKGDKGDTGLQGNTGPPGPVPEAPNDGTVYSRKNAGWVSADALYAPIANAHLSGVPTAPTPANAVNDGTLATTAFVHNVTGSAITEAPATGVNFARRNGAWNDIDALFALKAPLAGPVFTGDPQAPTAAKADNDNSIANTAHVKSVVADYAPLASPALTGTPTAPTPAPGDNSTKLATTGFCTASFAPLASPIFTGTPQAPSPISTSNDTSIATTLWVRNAIAASALTYAPLADPAFTGNPTAPTQARGDNDTSIATTAYVLDAITAAGTGTGLPDAPNDGKAYGRMSAAWVEVLGFYNNPTLIPGIVPPGILTGYDNPASGDYFQIQAKRLGASPYADGAYIVLGGPTYAPAGGPQVELNAGTNATGFKKARFKSNGCLELPNDPTIALDAATKQYVDNKVASGIFPSGTVLLFYQAAAPTGWTQVTTHNDKLLRVVGTVGGGSGGTNPFSTVNAQTVVGNHTLTAAELPSHTSTGAVGITVYPSGNNGYYVPMSPNGGWGWYQNYNGASGTSYGYASPSNNSVTYTNSFSYTNTITTTSSGTAGAAHNHPITMAIQYIDIILASKN